MIRIFHNFQSYNINNERHKIYTIEDLKNYIKIFSEIDVRHHYFEFSTLYKQVFSLQKYNKTELLNNDYKLQENDVLYLLV